MGDGPARLRFLAGARVSANENGRIKVGKAQGQSRRERSVKFRQNYCTYISWKMKKVQRRTEIKHRRKSTNDEESERSQEGQFGKPKNGH